MPLTTPAVSSMAACGREGTVLHLEQRGSRGRRGIRTCARGQDSQSAGGRSELAISSTRRMPSWLSSGQPTRVHRLIGGRGLVPDGGQESRDVTAAQTGPLL